MADEASYDVVVIGAGLGGLLAAAQFLRRGKRVVVVERLVHPGGRFTAKTFQGAQVSTGAVHMLPFGTNGELAGMLRALSVPHHIHDSEVFASFHAHGRQYVCHSLLQLAGVFGPRQFAQFVRIGAAMLLRAPRSDECALTFKAWLERRISRRDSPELYAYFERMAHFALSVDLAQLSYPETVETTKNMLRYGPPGVVEGGCAAITGALERRVLAGGGTICLQHDVLAIERASAAIAGVRARDKVSGKEILLRAPLVVSNIGPHATARLLDPANGHDLSPQPSHLVREKEPAEPLSLTKEGRRGLGESPPPVGEVETRREACGLKVHLLSDVSIIPHQGIMYCLDTERIAGIVQPSNSDRRLAPPGKHLLITHQILRGDDVNTEREAARADLRRLFGEDFGTRVRILTMSQYRGEWPVNRVVQGEDFSSTTQVPGLYLIGDAVKPSGYLMVEGVAQSVNTLLDSLDALDLLDGPVMLDGPNMPTDQPAGARSGRTHVPPKPARSRALRWLVSPPAPHPGS
jgi:phytoene dehydrogenase-like protein